MKVRYLTVKQLRHAASKYKYIAVRYDDGVIGINCKIQNTKKAKSASDETVTNAISYYPISFMEYISLKTPFLSTNKQTKNKNNMKTAMQELKENIDYLFLNTKSDTDFQKGFISCLEHVQNFIEIKNY